MKRDQIASLQSNLSAAIFAFVVVNNLAIFVYWKIDLEKSKVNFTVFYLRQISGRKKQMKITF